MRLHYYYCRSLNSLFVSISVWHLNSQLWVWHKNPDLYWFDFCFRNTIKAPTFYHWFGMTSTFHQSTQNDYPTPREVGTFPKSLHQTPAHHCYAKWHCGSLTGHFMSYSGQTPALAPCTRQVIISHVFCK